MAEKQEKREGVQRLAKVLDNRSNEHKDDSLIADFGVIRAGMKLKLNSYPVAIKPSDYSVCKHLNGSYDEPKLKKGDRVLVVWSGDEPVVIDRIVNANKL